MKQAKQYIALTLLILLCLSCRDNRKIKHEEFVNEESTFEEKQDSLRTVLLHSKPNELLKSNKTLQELYLKGLVHQIDDKIQFNLPFNLHGLDCGAPDCYSTNISFTIKAENTIKFPKEIPFTLLEQGCGFQQEHLKNGIFELIEQSSESINYYSKQQKSNLVILGAKRKLYYFPDTEPNTIRLALLDQLFEKYNEGNEQENIPYQSFVMTTNDYEHFLKNSN